MMNSEGRCRERMAGATCALQLSCRPHLAPAQQDGGTPVRQRASSRSGRPTNGSREFLASRRICATRRDQTSWASSRTPDVWTIFSSTPCATSSYVEKQIEKALPEMFDKATQPCCKQARPISADPTKNHVKRVEHGVQDARRRGHKASTARRSTASSRRRRTSPARSMTSACWTRP